MKLYEECKSCLFSSQLKKVEREQGAGEKLDEFISRVKFLCDNPPEDYCAPLLMRDINAVHKSVFGTDIDYSREKRAFNGALLAMEEEILNKISACGDVLEAALKYAMAANYIDFAKLADLDENSINAVISAAERARVGRQELSALKAKLKNCKTLAFLHDNCGEIVLDKILIRVIKSLYPQIKVYSVVRGGAIINDVTEDDAAQIGLSAYACVVQNGAAIPGTYLKEINAQTYELLNTCDVIISKGLGNLETLYGAGYDVFYCFMCKCRHMAERFNYSLWETAFVHEEKRV